MSKLALYPLVYGLRRTLLRCVFYITAASATLITFIGIHTYPTLPEWADKDYIFRIPRAVFDYEELLPHKGEEFSLWFAFYAASLSYLTLLALAVSCILLFGLRFDGKVERNLTAIKKIKPFLRILLLLGALIVLFLFILLGVVPFDSRDSKISVPLSGYSLLWYVVMDLCSIACMVELIIAFCRASFPERVVIKNNEGE